MRTRWEDPYSILGLPKTASERDIQRAFRRIALKDHPDRNPGDQRAAERFTRASAAYQRLKEAGWRVPDEAPGNDAWSEPWASSSSEAEEQEPLPKTWPDGTPIHYPTAEEIADVIAAAERPRSSRRWAIRMALVLAAIVLFVVLDWQMGSTRTVKGHVIDRHSATRPVYSRFGSSSMTSQTTEVQTELGTFTLGDVPDDVEVLVTVGRITGYLYAEPCLERCAEHRPR